MRSRSDEKLYQQFADDPEMLAFLKEQDESEVRKDFYSSTTHKPPEPTSKLDTRPAGDNMPDHEMIELIAEGVGEAIGDAHNEIDAKLAERDRKWNIALADLRADMLMMIERAASALSNEMRSCVIQEVRQELRGEVQHAFEVAELRSRAGSSRIIRAS